MSDHVTNAAPEAATAEAVAATTEAYAAVGKEAVEALEGIDLAVPEALRSAAEKAVTQSREAYERTKDAMEDTVEMLEQSIDKAGHGAAAINRKVIDLTQANLNSSFDLAKDLLSVLVEDLPYVFPGVFHDQGIQVEKAVAEPACHQTAHRGLAGTHESYQSDAVRCMGLFCRSARRSGHTI